LYLNECKPRRRVLVLKWSACTVLPERDEKYAMCMGYALGIKKLKK
jgi:hypothetical protein